MKKRFVCALLTLVLLVSLVPAMAMPTRAASLATSEAAITVIKQLEGYSQKCDEKGYIGYGTLCTGEGAHGGTHTTYEAQADKNLRTELKSLDAAVNQFASKLGLNLTQGKHDALVLFSFQNGTAWMSGTGEFRSAVVKGAKGSDFLNAICNWNTATEDDTRRMIEANMYLYGVYSSSRPSKFIRVNFQAVAENTEGEYEGSEVAYDDFLDGGFAVDAVAKWPDGTIAGKESRGYYYDVTTKPAPHMVPTASGYTFTGWYIQTENGFQKVTALTASHHNAVLIGGWAPTTMNPDTGIAVDYLIDKSQLLSEYVYVYQAAVTEPYVTEDEDGNTHAAGYDVEVSAAKFVQAKDADGKNIKASKFYYTGSSLKVDRDLIDENGTRWCRINYYTEPGMKHPEYWVKVSNKSTAGGSSASEDATIDITVTVVSNLGYVNRREKATIYSNKTGSYTTGTKLRIIDTATKDGFLWGKVAKDATGTASEGWIALMYTDYETVRSQQSSSTVSSGTVIATGFITYNGYVNVRSDAGTDNEIVGALYNGTEVKIYQTKFVNGLEWGLCDSGWFCLSYANITRKTNTTNTSDVGFTTYAFTGTLTDYAPIHDAPEGKVIQNIGGAVTVSNLVNRNGVTWGKTSDGWVMVSDEDGEPINVDLDVAKFTVASELTVRENPETAAQRVDTLSKGVEFNVNGTKQVIVKGETIWAYADKVGEGNKTYGGWVNLANKYVTRGDAPVVSETTNNNTPTGKTATIVGADSVRVRSNSSLSGKVIGSIKLGTTVNILGEQNGWYKIDYNVGSEYDSWVYGQYVEVKEGTVGSDTTGNGTTASTAGTGVGIIANTYSGVNVRATPGTSGKFLGKILPGTQVNILETRTVGSAKWGRVEQGWICMDYVQIISDLPQDVLDALLGANGGNGTGNNNTTGGSSTTTGAETAIYTGIVNQEVNVYKETDVNSDVVRVLSDGSNITMHEILEVVTVTQGEPQESGDTTTTTTTKTTTYWARVNDGYILDPAETVELDTLDEAVYTVTGSETLNVRNDAGTAGTDIVHRLNKGDQVKVTKLEIVKGNVWGFIESTPTDPVKTTDEDGNEVISENAWTGEGWISLVYTTKGRVSVNTGNTGSTDNSGNAGNTETKTEETKPLGSTGNTGNGGFVSNAGGYKYTGKVINTDSLNVRRTASTSAAVDAKLKRGASLVIYETCIAENMAWGRCDAGWVYLYYVDMTPVSGAVDARVVYNDNTIIYTDKDGSAVAGTYSRMAVIDIYEIVGNMVRTDLGWVSTDNLL